MKELPFILSLYDREVVRMIAGKYGLSLMEALRSFLGSDAYRMLSDIELEMWEFPPEAVFEMWEVEQVTGDPRNSIYIRRL